jgi:NDP-sugar pyrophosphorylase family protein
MNKPQIVVMAAGMGSRFGGAKQIEAVGPSGEIIIDYSLFDAYRAGFRRIVFIIRRDSEEAFRERINPEVEKLFEVRYAYQEHDKLPQGFSVPEGRTKPWGTAHAVMCAKEMVDAPFAVLNADDFYGSESFTNLYKFLSTAEDKNGIYDYCMVGYRLEKTLTKYGQVARGICTANSKGFLESIVERTKIQRFEEAIRYETQNGWEDVSGGSIVSMNMFGFTPGFCVELENRFPVFLRANISNPKAEFFLPSVVNELIVEKKAAVQILPTHSDWLGVTYREDLEPVRESIGALITGGRYSHKLWG